ncbi:MAG: hypothetical protein WD825_01005 [Gemmatimonadaceae bacterium]
MTVREWIAQRTPPPPVVLSERMLAALAGDADLPASRTADVCLAAATRSLDVILSGNCFTREAGGALDLLTVDGLAAYAFEHASQLGSMQSMQSLDALAVRGAHQLGLLMTQRV